MDEKTRRASFRPALWGAIAMFCGALSMALPLFNGGGLKPLRTVLLVIFCVLFIINLAAAIHYRPRR